MAQRQGPQNLDVVQRQVTARPVGDIRAPQREVRVDARADTFTNGLVTFVDAIGGAVRQYSNDQKDAQAAMADIGLDGYNKAMGAALDSEPELFDDQERLQTLDQEMRSKYLGNVEDEDILQRANMRIDNYLSAAGQTYQYQKAEKARFELGARTLQLSVEKLEEQVASGSDRGQAIEALKGVYQHLRTSPSFRISKENTEKLVQGLQETFAKDGSKRVLLADAFMDDPDLSIETRMALQLDRVQGLKETEAEKQAKKFQLYQAWEPLIDKGKFTWDTAKPYVEAGIISAGDVRAGMRRQADLIEKRRKEAEKDLHLMTANPTTLTAKDFTKWEALARKSMPKDQYYAVMRQTGGANPVVVAQAQRAASTLSKPVETEDQIPAAFNQLVDGDAGYLYGAGMLGQHIPPEQLEDLGAYFYLTQSLGKSKVEAYNLMVEGASAKYLDVDKLRQAKLKDKVRSSLDIDGKAPQEIVGNTVNIAMKLSKVGMDPDEAVKTAISWTKDAYTVTPYGAIPKARYGSYTSEDAMKKRLDYTAKQLADEQTKAGNELDPDDLQVNLLDDGRYFFVQKGGFTPIGSTSFRLMTDNAPELPDGTPTVEGKRQDQVINDTINNARPRITAEEAWRQR